LNLLKAEYVLSKGEGHSKQGENILTRNVPQGKKKWVESRFQFWDVCPGDMGKDGQK